MTPIEVIAANKELIELVTVHQYLPQESNANFMALTNALRELNPKAVYRTDCAGCITEIVRTAKAHLLAYESQIVHATVVESPVKMTFPKHDTPAEKRTRKPMSQETKDKIAKALRK